MRVAICADGIFPLSVGGIQRHSRLLIETLARRYPELRLVVIHPHEEQRLFPGFPNVEEVTVTPRPGKRQYILECHDLSRRVLQSLRRFPDAIVYAQGLMVWKGAREVGPRLIVNPHGLESFQSLGLSGQSIKDRCVGLVFRQVLRSTMRRPRHVVSLGGTLTQILRREIRDPDRRIAVLPNGVIPPPSDVVRPIAEARPLRALFVGRFAANKGIPDLLAAIGLLNHRGLMSRFQVDLVGAGPLLAPLSAANASPNVTFHGPVDDETLDRLYREAHVFVLPTLFEGMPTVVLEAMARRLPILVTDVGATREMVDASNGFIIPKQDPGHLADRLIELADMPPAQRAAMGDASWQRVQDRFTWDRVADAHYRLFESLHEELTNATTRGRGGPPAGAGVSRPAPPSAPPSPRPPA
jgi:glycosyltransferase involved in cell wall biosynthesis